jgi:hypothetical protein
MSPEGAKAVAKSLNDPTGNPPVKARVASNGPSHGSVVHVTYGEPKPYDKTDKNGQVIKTVIPERPRAHTVA